MPLCWSLDDVGLIARDVDDVALLLSAVAGPHLADPTASRRRVPDYFGPGEFGRRPPGLALLVDMLRTTEPAVQDHVDGVVRRVAEAGATVRQIGTSIDSATLFAVQQVLLASEAAAAHSQLLADHPDAYLPKLRVFIQMGQFIPASVYLAAQRLRRRARAAIAQLFRGVDCLLLQSQPDVAPAFGTDVSATLQAPWTLLGLPSMSLPSGLSPEALPLGIQLVGRHFREDQLRGCALVRRGSGQAARTTTIAAQAASHTYRIGYEQGRELTQVLQSRTLAVSSAGTQRRGSSLKIKGKRHWLWRTVDKHGVVLDILVQQRRDQVAAETLLRHVLATAGAGPRVVNTDKLASYPPALRRMLPTRSTDGTRISTIQRRMHTSRRINVNLAIAEPEPPANRASAKAMP